MDCRGHGDARHLSGPLSQHAGDVDTRRSQVVIGQHRDESRTDEAQYAKPRTLQDHESEESAGAPSDRHHNAELAQAFHHTNEQRIEDARCDKHRDEQLHEPCTTDLEGDEGRELALAILPRESCDPGSDLGAQPARNLIRSALVINKDRHVSGLVDRVAKHFAHSVDGQQAQPPVDTWSAGAHDPRDASQAADDPTDPVRHSVDDLVAQPDTQVGCQPLAEHDAAVAAGGERVAFDECPEDGEGRGVFRDRIECDETGAVALAGCAQHSLADDTLDSACDFTFFERQVAQGCRLPHRSRERWPLEVLWMLQRHVTRTETGGEIDHIGPVAVLHGGEEHRKEHPEGNGRQREERAAPVPP